MDLIYAVGDFNIELVGINEYKLVLFLNIKEKEWQGISDPAVYMYKYGMQRGKWNKKDNAIEMITGYDGIKYVMMLLRRYKGMEPSMIDIMDEILADELDKSYQLV